MCVATKGFVSRHVLTPRRAAAESHPDLLSWNDPPPRYSEKPAANELLSMLDPLSASTNQLRSPMATKSGSSADLKSAGMGDSDIFLDSHVSSCSSFLSMFLYLYLLSLFQLFLSLPFCSVCFCSLSSFFSFPSPDLFTYSYICLLILIYILASMSKCRI